MKVTGYPNFGAAVSALTARGVEHSFFQPGDSGETPSSAASPPVLSATFDTAGVLGAVFLLHVGSSEVGLWVRPALRGQGLGRHCFTAALEDASVLGRRSPIYARTCIGRTASAEAMRRLLVGAGFRRVAVGDRLDLWVLYRDLGKRGQTQYQPDNNCTDIKNLPNKSTSPTAWDKEWGQVL